MGTAEEIGDIVSPHVSNQVDDSNWKWIKIKIAYKTSS